MLWVVVIVSLLSICNAQYAQYYYYTDSQCATDPVYASSYGVPTCTPIGCTAPVSGSAYYSKLACSTANGATLTLPTTTLYAEFIGYQSNTGCSGAFSSISAYSLLTCINFGTSSQKYACTQASGIEEDDFNSDNTCKTSSTSEFHKISCFPENPTNASFPFYNSYNCTGYNQTGAGNSMHADLTSMLLFTAIASVVTMLLSKLH